MRSKIFCLLCVLFSGWGFSITESQAPTSKAGSQSASAKPRQRLTVSEQVASLVKPILDAQQKFLGTCGDAADSSNCTAGDPSQEERLGELLYQLTQKKGPSADEALVVLMSFYVGESQEETDAVIARGRRMLKYLNKYRYVTPSVPGRVYPRSMLKDRSVKADDFRGAIKAIRKGWHSTAENPEG